MDIQEFFQQSAGRWFSQRTNHHLASKQGKSDKSNIKIEILSQDDPKVIALCQQYKIDPALAWGGMGVTQEEAKTGSSVIVPIADPENPQRGTLLHNIGYAETTRVPGRYIMGSDDVLTLITESESLQIEERLWFVSPNLRLRTSILKQSDGFSMTSFCSEIRMGMTPPKPQTTDAAQV